MNLVQFKYIWGKFAIIKRNKLHNTISLNVKFVQHIRYCDMEHISDAFTICNQNVITFHDAHHFYEWKCNKRSIFYYVHTFAYKFQFLVWRMTYAVPGSGYNHWTCCQYNIDNWINRTIISYISNTAVGYSTLLAGSTDKRLIFRVVDLINSFRINILLRI